MTRPAHERVLSRAVPGPDGCVIFTGAKDGGGYGNLTIGSRTDGSRRLAKAHRVVYEALVGPVPEGLVIDHLCRVRACVNYLHLEAVTQQQNIMRGVSIAALNATRTECASGHPFTPENTRIATTAYGTRRYCRACSINAARRSRGVSP